MAKESLKRMAYLGIAAGLALAPSAAQAIDCKGYALFLAAGCNGPHGCHAGSTNTAPSGVDQDEQGYYKPPASPQPEAKTSSVPNKM